MGECQVSVIYGTFWTRLLQANHTQVHDSYCSMSCMYVLTLAMLVEGCHRILDSRNMVLITGKAFTILGLVVKWSDLRIQRCTAMNAGSATGSHGARYIRVQNSDRLWAQRLIGMGPTQPPAAEFARCCAPCHLVPAPHTHYDSSCSPSCLHVRLEPLLEWGSECSRPRSPLA